MYKSGSAALAHENHKLVVGRIRLLGIKNEDLNKEEDSGTISLTERDRKKAVQLLGKGSMEEWRSELQRMLYLNVKAEIQAVDVDGRGGLELYLNSKLMAYSG